MTMMGSQMLDILRQGVWASLTGGWYYDPHHRVSTNTFHLYTWLVLFCLPFSLHLCAPPVWWTWAIYSCIILVFFSLVKTTNLCLHHLFDTGEVFEDKGENGTPKERVETMQESFGLQDLSSGGAGAGQGESSTDPVSGSSRNSVVGAEGGATSSSSFYRGRGAEGRKSSRPTSTFDLKVDVHSLDKEREEGEQTRVEMETEGRSDTDVVIMVDESPVGRLHSKHEASRQTELGENYQAEPPGVPVRGDPLGVTQYPAPEHEASPPNPEVEEASPQGGRELHMSNRSAGEVSFSSLATSGQLTVSGQTVTDVKDVSRSEDSNQQPARHRFSNKSNLARSLPTDSQALLQEAKGQLCSLELAAILDTASPGQPRSRTGQVRRTKSALEPGEPGGHLCVTRDVTSQPVSLDRGIQDTGAELGTVLAGGSDLDLDTYQEQLEEATRALLVAGKYLEKDCRQGSGEFLPMDGGQDETDSGPGAEQVGHSSLLSTVGLDWLFSDSEPDLAPSTPKPVGLQANVRSRSESPRLASVPDTGADKSASAREPRDSSHGSSGTDTETRALLNKLEKVESALEESTGGLKGEASDGLELSASGARPKRRPGSRRLRQQVGDEDRRWGRRQEEYQMPASNTLYDDAAGLKLFLDILNGPDGQNKEAEAELRRLIDRRRSRMEEDGERRRSRGTGDSEGEDKTKKQKLATRRRRRHNAQSQNDQLAEAGVALPERVLDERRVEGEERQRRGDGEEGGGARQRRGEKRGGGRRGREEKEGDEEATHLAADHEDTSSGAVHCFRDEFGNWQTYTFGGDTQASTQVGAPAVASRALATLLNRHQSSEGRPPPPDPPQQETWPDTEGVVTPASTRSSLSADSGLTVILDSPAMVFQPSGERTRSRDSSSAAAGGGGREGYWSRESSGTTAPGTERQQSAPAGYWSRDNTVLGSTSARHHSAGAGAAAATPGFRRYNNPIHMFTESLNFLDRTRQAASSASIATNGELTFSSTFGGGGGGSAQLTRMTRIDESSLAGQLNLNSGAGGHSLDLGSGVSSQLHIGSLGCDSAGGGQRGGNRASKYHLLRLPWLPRGQGIKVWLDRLQLLNIMDQDRSLFTSLACIFLSVLVAVLGSLVLQTGYYRDLWLVLFCAVLCSCQYSLLKSVQPDASSPTHGFNPTTVFSRPIYFSFCCLLALLLEHTLTTQGDLKGFTLYGSRGWLGRSHLLVARDVVYTFILAFPVVFTLGLLPQVNTALMYLLEQVDIHLFGGNAASSLQSSVYCVLRSLLAVVVMFGFAYGGLTESSHSAHAQEVLFSIFCSLSVCLSYHLSRCSGDPTVVLSVMKRHFLAILSEDTETDTAVVETGGGEAASSDTSGVTSQSPVESEPGTVCPQGDPLPRKLRRTVNSRLKNDALVCLLQAVLVFLVHQSGLFTQAAPTLDMVLWLVAVVLGFLLHYLLPHLRKQTPWKCFNTPLMASHEQGQFEVRAAAKVMWWERVLLWADILERSVLYPLIFLSAVTQDRPVFESSFGVWGGSLAMVVTMMKCLRSVWSDSSRQYFTLLLSILLFQYEPSGYLTHLTANPSDRRTPFLLDFFLTSVLSLKLAELYLKCQFVITYIAPHQINWGSAFHAFAQPFSVPHTAMLFLQAVISSVLSTPLNPLLGSTIFICSYVRPVKFWERNYNTKRTDHSNTRLASQFETRNPGADDNNLNSIFYEHLTRSLQHSLAGDLMLGRWGTVQQGDCFVLASDYLNCLVHIIELGNGLCTFQVRGLEFRGTYCQQREVEAISEGVEEDEACCCCEPGHLPYMLSVNMAFSQRWLAWEVSAVKYVLEGYSISDNSAQSMLQVWDLRKVLISYYIKSIIYYTVRSPKLSEWLANPSISEATATTADKNFVDLDPIFNSNIDEDFDFRSSGITRHSFCSVYLSWIQYCAQSRDRALPAGRDSQVVSLCFSLALLGRRALGAASNNTLTSVEFFLIGLHALFKGDFRITCSRDEWVFSDMELLRKVVAPAVRMSLKLHQDHFMSPDEYEESSVLYEAISQHERELVISHEGDPAWRHAVLSGAPSLLALRHVVDDGTDEYKIIMLNKRHLSFRVIKLNRECVRGLWAGQQQELIFLRNRNPERGSIQNAKPVLRNLINSSCDQPIGYPIYVSPLTTSYSDTNNQVTAVTGGPLSLSAIKSCLHAGWLRAKDRCISACSRSGSAECDQSGGPVGGEGGGVGGVGAPQGGNRASLVSSSASKPSSGTLVSLAGLLGGQVGGQGTNIEMQQLGGGRRARSASGESGGTPSLARAAGGQRQMGKLLPNPVGATPGPASFLAKINDVHTPSVTMARIVDPLQVYDNMNLGRRIDPMWPDCNWRDRGGRNNWKSWIPLENMVGPVVHRWTPSHSHPMYRSHTDKTILLLRLGEKYVPIAEQAVELLPSEENPEGEKVGEERRERGESSQRGESSSERRERGDSSSDRRERGESSSERRERGESSFSEKEKSNSQGEKERSRSESMARETGLGSRSLMSVDSSRSLAGIPSISEREEEEEGREELRKESSKEREDLVLELRVSSLQKKDL